MKTDLKFNFIVDMQNNTITIEREFSAKRQLVWDCYTKSELLDRWFAPKSFTTKTKTMDFREGGYWHYAMVDSGGHEYWGRMDYQVVHPIDDYIALDGFCDEFGDLDTDLPRSSWHVTFTDESNYTLVHTVVTYESSHDLEKVVEMGMKDGLMSTLERLDDLLVTLAD